MRGDVKTSKFLFLILALGGPFAVLLGAWWISEGREDLVRLRRRVKFLSVVSGLCIAAFQLAGDSIAELDEVTQSSSLQTESSIAGFALGLILALLLLRHHDGIADAAFPPGWRAKFARFMGFTLGGWALRLPFAVIGLLLGGLG